MVDNNPSNLNETQVQFKIFISIDESKENIEKIYESIIEFTESLSSNYIWNNESFELKKPVKSESDSKSYYSCQGICDFGDNIEDEWFIVYILNSLTLKYSKKIVAQIYDSDGEFLLIHSSNFLPQWAQSAGNSFISYFQIKFILKLVNNNNSKYKVNVLNSEKIYSKLWH